MAIRDTSAETAPTLVVVADLLADSEEEKEETVTDAMEDVDTRLLLEAPDPDLVLTRDLLTAAAHPPVDAENLVPALPQDVETTPVPGLLVAATETVADRPVTTEWLIQTNLTLHPSFLSQPDPC